jgi:hypothetical protein
VDWLRLRCAACGPQGGESVSDLGEELAQRTAERDVAWEEVVVLRREVVVLRREVAVLQAACRARERVGRRASSAVA